MNKTALQEFIDNVIPSHIIGLYDIRQSIKKGLEKEKEQIKEAYMDGNRIKDEFYNPEEYYNETYNKNYKL